jgi:molybdopterin-guanine dinucleotide biosynthesis protein A
MSTTMGECTAIVLAGGRSQRFDGAEKLISVVDGVTLVQRSIMAAETCARIIVVGPPGIETTTPRAEEDRAANVVQLQESPPGGGPVAALAAGLRIVSTPLVVVLAGDLPFAQGLPEAVVAEISHNAPGADAVVPLDTDDHLQPLAAAYRTSALRRALRDLGRVQGISMRLLLSRLDVVELPAERLPPDALVDIDTATDLVAARSLATSRTELRR